MAAFYFLLILLGLGSCFNLSLGGPLIKSDGDLDKLSVERHILQLEETVSDLKSQFQAQEQKQAAVLSSLLSKFVSTSGELSNLQTEFVDLQAKYNRTGLDLSAVRDKLTANVKELTNLKTEFKAMKIDYDVVRIELASVRNYTNENTQDLDHATSEIYTLKKQFASTNLSEGTFQWTSHFSANQKNVLELIHENVTSALAELSSQNSELTAEMEKVKEVLNITETKSVAQESVQHIMEHVELELQNMRQNMTDIQLIYARGVAFSSALISGTVINIGQTVVYDHANLNVGNGYDITTGIFTCPRSGIYIFHVHALANTSKGISLQLFLNENVIVTVNGFGPNHFDSGSNTAIIRVEKGEKVFVRASIISDLYEKPNYWYNTFSGYLVNPSFYPIN